MSRCKKEGTFWLFQLNGVIKLKYDSASLQIVFGHKNVIAALDIDQSPLTVQSQN
jgi:hypothetical protein